METTPLPGTIEKAKEYAIRIINGENIDAVLKGAEVFRAQVEALVAEYESKNETGKEIVEAVKNYEIPLTPEFLNTQDTESLRAAIDEFIPKKYHAFLNEPELLKEIWDKKYYIDD